MEQMLVFCHVGQIQCFCSRQHNELTARRGRIINEARTFLVTLEGSQLVLLAVSIVVGHIELGSLTVM